MQLTTSCVLLTTLIIVGCGLQYTNCFLLPPTSTLLRSIQYNIGTSTTSRKVTGSNTDTAAADASKELSNLHNSLFSSIEQQLGLKRTDFTDYEQVNSWTDIDAGVIEGKADWFDEEKGAKLTGVAKYSHVHCTGDCSYSIDGWMGPSRAVPHMTLTLLYSSATDSSSGSYGISSDFIPRGPTPIGSDQRYIDLYYNDKVIADLYTAVAGKAAVTHLPPPLCLSSRLLRSPLHLSVTGLEYKELTAAATALVQQWLQWIDAAEEVQARQRGAMNMRDDKIREFAYRAALSRYSQLLQQQGGVLGSDLVRRVAAGVTGPLAEAYVGGGS